MARVFWGTRVMEIVKKHDSGDLVWKRIKLTSTRKANAKKCLHCVWQEVSRAMRKGKICLFDIVVQEVLNKVSDWNCDS
ncbi:hypothetical protein PVK06_024828 [Gossypium arboreum]|uniref:Uncharacterized protein n=1 Tax=Gossypium arboreum TaxID=29729 RepID=A0ABR0PEZ7_GOSAR|nr:hypothetical protein PVK06_024828 [Gossypium arboreum]